MSDILNYLNKEQRAAVVETEGPVVVLAGAGSGKTRVLVHRVVYLITEKGVPADNILMVTFTNKAAGEMRERIEKMLHLGTYDGIVESPIVGTFHSVCARILRRDGVRMGIPHHFGIYDTQDSQEVVKEAMVSLDVSLKNFRPRSVLSAISSAKSQMVDPATFASTAHGYWQETIAKIYPVYQQLLRKHDSVDFDDLLLQTIRLLERDAEVLNRYQEQFRYVLVDEYQDTNQAQYVLTRLLSGKHKNVCIVGDFSQSIYSFRGADYRNLEKFKKDYPDAKTFSLSQNYRSTQNILNAAYSVISHNNSHPVLSLWTNQDGGRDIRIIEGKSEYKEAEKIVDTILSEQTYDASLSFSDIAILYRTNAQSRVIEEVLLHRGIPYVLVGGTRFYERREIKDVLAYLSYLANQNDNVSYRRIEKLGKRRLAHFKSYLEEFLHNGYIENKKTIDILDEVLSRTTYLDKYHKDVPEDLARLENIKELRSVAIEFENLIEFLENVALVEQEQLSDRKLSGNARDAVTLMTLHAAKGLEYDMVFMAGMEEGLFPHSQSLFESEQLEEERRLCYVGITRARKQLFLTHAKRRLIFGQRSENTLSRFVFELPEEVLNANFVSQDKLDGEFF